MSFRKKGFDNRLHYFNTPKQLILVFYDCKNDNFHVKIVIVLLLLLLFGSKINCGYTHDLFLSKKVKKECINRLAFPCLNPSLSVYI